jgi:hypothetical protein
VHLRVNHNEKGVPSSRMYAGCGLERKGCRFDLMGFAISVLRLVYARKSLFASTPAGMKSEVALQNSTFNPDCCFVVRDLVDVTATPTRPDHCQAQIDDLLLESLVAKTAEGRQENQKNTNSEGLKYKRLSQAEKRNSSFSTRQVSKMK